MTPYTPVALLDVKDVASLWGISPIAVQRAAENAGLLVRMGRKPKIYEADLERLVRACQGQAKAPASTGESRPKAAPDNGLSSTARQSAKQAAQTVERLTKPSRTTSTPEASAVTPIRQRRS